MSNQGVENKLRKLAGMASRDIKTKERPGMNKNSSSRLERRKKWWEFKNSNSRVTRAHATGTEDTNQTFNTTQSTTSSRGFTSTQNNIFPARKPKQKQFKNKGSMKNSARDLTHNTKLKTKPGASKAEKNKSISNDKSDKLKHEKDDEKSTLPEVTIVRSFNTAETEMKPSVHSPKKYVLFVGNLPYSVTKEQIEDHFRKTGGVKAVRIPKEKGSERAKGFAYVEFNSTISHRIALRLHNTTLGGRKINVEFTSAGGKNEHRRQKLKKKNERLAKFKMPFDT